MERNRLFLGLVIVVLLAVGYLGLKEFRYSNASECYACKRTIHAHSKTVALVNGRSTLFCCPACALSEHRQGKEPVKITQLTAFLTGDSLQPDSAYMVRGSNVNMCARDEAMIDGDKQPATVRYDRCFPSMYAFAKRNEAVDFAREHGGEVIPFKQLEESLAK